MAATHVGAKTTIVLLVCSLKCPNKLDLPGTSTTCNEYMFCAVFKFINNC